MDREDAQRHRPGRTPAPHATCVVVDDHPAVLGTVADLLEASGFSVVGRARTAAEGKEKIERRAPTVAVVDVCLPDTSGIDLARELRETVPETAVILYTGSGDTSLVLDAFDAGARGIVLKDASLADLVRAVETVARGETYVDPTLAGLRE
jgi:DNA-binding NarL/FixJ family response regulator